MSLIYTHFVNFEYSPTVIMPPFRRPHLSHRLVLVASGGVAFRGPPDLCCRRKTSYTACRNPSQQAPSLGVPRTSRPMFPVHVPPRQGVFGQMETSPPLEHKHSCLIHHSATIETPVQEQGV